MKNLTRLIPLAVLPLIVGIAAQISSAQVQKNAPMPAGPTKNWKIEKSHLLTQWSKLIDPSSPLPEYPRPQFVRTKWQNLNGLWEYTFTDSKTVVPPKGFSGKILVPYPMESALSGLGMPSEPNKRLWYRRMFTVPPTWKDQKIILHFGAVNWDSTVSVNGMVLSAHQGGYDAFDVDATQAIRTGNNEIVVSAWNPLRSDSEEMQVLGKQRLKPSGIFYTAATGIWQTVWIEPVPKYGISDLKLTPNIDKKTISIRATTQGDLSKGAIRATIRDGKRILKTTTWKAANFGRIPKIALEKPRLWTPTDPHLYSLKLEYLREGHVTDTVDSYFAMRKVSLAKDKNGWNRIMLNNKFVFQIGALDQGYWPDGIYTAPTDSALKYDIEAAKQLGFNLLRKHAKVEPDRWYYWTDKLGMLVWQDMPQGFAGKDGKLTTRAKLQFDLEWQREINALYNHPSIIVWTPFNEGWGQHDTERIVKMTRELDPTRLVNHASGWVDKGVGDIDDIHAYPGPGVNKPTDKRAAVNGEFGGVTLRVPGHMWTTDLFGYGTTLRTTRQVTKRYQQLLKSAYQLRDSKGSSAFVYTQLTDVEQESNGLLTYDRALIKADAKIVRAANLGKFLPLPKNPKPDLVPTAQDEPAIWTYTTQAPGNGWADELFLTADWKSGTAPFGQGLEGIKTKWTAPDIWLRREVELPSSLPEDLGFLTFHDEDVEIYINGVLAATATGYTVDYATLPMNQAGRAALRPGKNVIAVHCHQTRGGQFIDVGIIQLTKD